MIIGTLLIAAGVALLLLSGLGTGPIDALNAGLAGRVGISVGMISIPVSIMFISLAWFLGKVKPGAGTFISMVAFAPILDFFLFIAPHEMGSPPGLVFAVAEWVSGATLIAAGSSLMIVANMGVGAYDAATLAVSNRLKLSIPKSRAVLDLSVGASAFLLTGPIWLGTVGLMLAMPPLLAVFLRVARRMMPQEEATAPA